ncbi:MAG TPA: glutathione S-transferase family protein [Candidatus Dormibacteraeota bacterium]|nr:glutathione S-transferase family protein [Candidatus Dormibacteraeota bacterium]
MPDQYKIFGNELSPYSVKVRSYLRYKHIPHEWVVRTPAVEEEFGRYAKLPLIPLVVTPDGRGLQDSTPIIEQLERVFPEPSIHHPDPAVAFLSAMIEEYADEWGNKPMFHYRWFYPADQESAGERLARSMMPGLPDEQIAGGIAMIKQRMIPRLSFVGSTAATKGPIEDSYRRQLAILERHLAGRTYLFGERPAFADFGLYAQLYQLSTDPTPAALMRASAPHVAGWIQEMLGPRAEGNFEPWAALAPTLMPLLRDEIAGVFLPWSTANARALAAGEKEFTIELNGTPFTQETQKYHAKSLAALKARYAAVENRKTLDPILEEAGCLPWLR